MTRKDLGVIQQYRDYFHNGDRREIFKLLSDKYGIERAIYPGSYIDIGPSFFIQTTVYIDSFKKTNQFFKDKSLYDYISKNSVHKEKVEIRYHNSDYNLDFGEKVENFDLLISLYTRFVSQVCKKYLKSDGILLANNSHGDAGMAYLDNDYEFIAVIYRSNSRYRLTEKNLGKYFIPKKPDLKITMDYLRKIGRGVGYTKSASMYVFRKVKI